MNENERKYIEKVIRSVVGAAFEVSNTLGTGFLEKVYERALMVELQGRQIKAASQVPLNVIYKGHEVGRYIADLVVEDKLLIELKCVKELGKEHMAQCINYLAATGLHICLLLNFQHPRLEWKRVVLNY
jgi:GxxExxY protein